MARQLSLFSYGITRKSTADRGTEAAVIEEADIEEAVIDEVNRVTAQEKPTNKRELTSLNIFSYFFLG